MIINADFGTMDVTTLGHVDIIVTSPPYNLGMDYSLYDDGEAYDMYVCDVYKWLLQMYKVLDVGGRLCINVPLDINKPAKQAVYADYVEAIKDCGFNYNTSIVWNENNISRRCAWGSWMQATAPFVTAPVEMIIVAYKGQNWKIPKGESDITRDEFLEYTLGIWKFPGEKPKRVGHPAPFPEELPRRLIKLYSMRGATILDPFVGSGTTCKVAQDLGRNAIGIDIDPAYCAIAEARCGIHNSTM